MRILNKISAMEKTVVRSSIDSGRGLDLDSILKELGQFGRFHLFSFALVAIPIFAAAIYNTNYIFLAADAPYRCIVPECEVAGATEFNPAWLRWATPSEGWKSRCFRYTPLDGSCTNGSFGRELSVCTEWIYQSHDTIVAEFNLACQEWKRTLVGTIHNIGMLVSLPIFGFISDKWGRKTAISLSATLVGVIGTLKAFSVSYEMYVIVEFLETVAGASVYPAAYILTIELLGQDKRVFVTIFLGIVLVLGGISFALIAKAIPYWRTWILVVYPPSVLFLSYLYLLPESIRWLMTTGNKDRAVAQIQRAAKFNNVTLSDELIQKLKEEKEKPGQEKKELAVGKASLMKQVLRSPVIMTRLAICCFWWITCTFVFYGLAVNSVTLAGDKYMNFILVVSVEIVSVVANALLLDRIGRKRTLMTAFWACGVVCITIPFVPKSLPWAATLLYLIGKIMITMAFSGIYMYTSELFPTHGRHSLLGFCSMVGRLGSIVAPQMPLLQIYLEHLPSLLFGSSAVVSALLMLLTPETLNTHLPDTIQEAEDLAHSGGTLKEAKDKIELEAKDKIELEAKDKIVEMAIRL